ncbi:putative F-box protein [Cardamine amara subsp. amara]|uniref:F-box protein n=1 Tax=Cardamine amara subsp. amara TaxID=228776 RepID=A0ABD1AXY1_CARAN
MYKLTPTFVNGWIYWFSRDKTKLVAFDLHMEMFRVVQNPIVSDEASSSSSSVYMHMGSVDDDPLVLCGFQREMEMACNTFGGSLTATQEGHY